MEKKTYKRNAKAMIYLTACALNARTPDSEKLKTLDMNELFEVCQGHILTACTAYALESAGIFDHNFTQAKEKAIRKNILFDAERNNILKRLESENIWYMPLKGSLLKDWYPKLGMRQMSDNDILCDGSKREQIRDIMLDMGFTCEHFGESKDDAYSKQPVFNFEMHNELFDVSQIGKLNEYYRDVKNRLIKDENNACGYHFRIEDFYIYLIAHEYKHFTSGGTGVRSLADTYVLLKKFGDTMDKDYLTAELEKLGIADYEKQSRELAMKVFGREQLSDADKKLLDYYIFSGSYGTLENCAENDIERYGQGSKLRFILHRLFPPMNVIKTWYPFFYRHKWLIPVLLICRPFKGIFTNGTKIKKELHTLFKK